MLRPLDEIFLYKISAMNPLNRVILENVMKRDLDVLEDYNRRDDQTNDLLKNGGVV